MSHVITEWCQGTCDTSCVDVCPIDCIQGPLPVNEIRKLQLDGKRDRLREIQMYIDPETCIDCGACVPECPMKAIYEDFNLPERLAPDASRNVAFFQ
ncbi:4Fe-4S dicluster domain-containing protein [Persicimonas caeni]|uniref:Ferredoxin n=1 Tax=Persicimonas caeni TaxID=2292766 RepID=A0A4Y6PS60_PERCE|nr:4Fe-4S binding protein [Persicimonas caeni]QDG51184.1 4Fe-4S dicluster domain-containing protein [Persicimonas caeni]QED32405.1 4Fe-4S dicluster domain-containing protein [Persicimonas caeni]